jgi:threonyl-tRNA synthetase
MVLPGRLGASYVDENDKDAVPIMIHHAVFGSMGRFLAMLLEHHGGDLPFWLSPDQVAVVPISEAQAGYAEQVLADLCEAGVRAVLYDGNETLSRRLVDIHAAKLPVALVVGAREVAAGSVAVRERDGSQQVLDLSAAVELLRVRR